jgi:hypothetical protein
MSTSISSSLVLSALHPLPEELLLEELELLSETPGDLIGGLLLLLPQPNTTISQRIKTTLSEEIDFMDFLLSRSQDIRCLAVNEVNSQAPI